MKTLYRVTIRKPVDFYVIAETPAEAYDKVRKFLDNNNFYVTKDRELHMIEVLAEAYKYTNCHQLLL